MNNINKIEKLSEIERKIKECRRCRLYLHRKNPVPGEGDPEKGIIFIGEAPGAQEDIFGRPFVGAAGKVLNELLGLIDLKREDVFITNVVKCRPPNNRDPTHEEIEKCSIFLDKQLEIIKPKIIVTLGRHSTKYIFSKMGKKFESILKVHGKVVQWNFHGQEIKIFPTLHPAAALYNPGLRKILETDFKKLKNIIMSELRYKKRCNTSHK